MTNKTRTIEELRNSMTGKIYVSFNSEEVFRRFLEDAETEGYTIGGMKPTESDASQDIKAIECDKTISNCGAIGHMAYQAGGSDVHRIDYESYVNSEDSYEVNSL